MNLTPKRLLSLTVGVLLVAGAVVGIAIATGPDDETPITGEALATASAKALQYVGSGMVTDSEMGDEEGYYEVEVTLQDGTEIDVHLDQEFNVISTDSDEDEDDADTND